MTYLPSGRPSGCGKLFFKVICFLLAVPAFLAAQVDIDRSAAGEPAGDTVDAAMYAPVHAASSHDPGYAAPGSGGVVVPCTTVFRCGALRAAPFTPLNGHRRRPRRARDTPDRLAAHTGGWHGPDARTPVPFGRNGAPSDDDPHPLRGTLATVGGVIAGLGVGLAADEPAAGLLVGAGVGMITTAFLRAFGEW